MVYCPHCGWPNKANSKFCSNCSGVLSETPDVICPVCGTSNAAGTTVCVRCGARLDRASAPPSQSGGTNPSQASQPGRDSPGPTPGEEMPNWFRQMESRADQPEYPPLDESTPEAPAWLENSGDEPETADEGEEEQDESAVDDKGAAEDDAGTDADGESEADADEVDEDSEEDVEGTDESEESPHLTVSPEPDFILPSWLSDSSADSNARSETEQPRAQASKSENVADETGTNTSSSAADESGPADKEHMPEWLRILNTPADEEPEKESNAAAEDDIPDWLREMTAPESESEPAETAATSTTQAEPTVETTPDYFDTTAPEPAQIEPEKTPAEASGGETPPIVVEQAAAPADEISLTEPESAEQEPVVPAWLGSTSDVEWGASEDESTGVWPPVPSPATAASNAEKIPLDLAELPTAQSLEPVDQKGQEPVGRTPEDVASGLTSQAPTQDESTDQAAAGQETEDEEQLPFGAAALELEGEEIPEWVRELAPAEGQPGEEQAEIPDWLREASAAAPSASLNESAPINDQAADRFRRAEEVTEQSGPLAGVVGVIPLAPAVTRGHGPSETAAIRATGGKLFEAVLAAEQAAAPAVEQPRASNWQNRVIYLFVLLAALVPLFIPSDLAGIGLLTNYNTPTVPFHDAIQAVPAGATVLMAFDYDAGQSLEMDPIASVVAGHLARRKVNIVALSTLPAGARLSQTVLDGVAAQAPDWKPGLNFVNLGYLRGEEKGLRELADAWLPGSRLDFTQRSLGSLPLTARLKGLQDLSLVIVLAGSDENLRGWMEQVQPGKQTVFVAAVSAAVEPSARNYLGSKQLAGLVRGLTGAAEYQALTQQTGMPIRTVDAQSLTQWLIAALILVANIAMLAGLVRPRTP